MVNIIRYIRVLKGSEEEDYEDKYEVIESCPECKSKNILIDYHKKESYCADCGLVVKDYQLLSISDYEYFIYMKNKLIQNKKTEK